MRASVKTLKAARAFRRTLSPPEAMLWARLRQRNDDQVRFRRQHPIGPYIRDFFCAKAQFAIETDGHRHLHGDQPTRDERRDAWLLEQGVSVLRIDAAEVFRNPDDVADSMHMMAVDRLGARR